jgi:uncharacterized protein YlxW (UPF0749 family)
MRRWILPLATGASLLAPTLPTVAAPKRTTSHARTRRAPARTTSPATRAEMLAGLTGVTGPGVTVTLRPFTGTLEGTRPANVVIHDYDVNAVLDALRAAGAEALAVGDENPAHLERIVATTAARPSRGGVMINETLLRAPIRILAIGDGHSMSAELREEGGVLTRTGLDLPGMAEIQESTVLALPAARATQDFRYARTVTPVAPAPGNAAGGTLAAKQPDVRTAVNPADGAIPVRPPDAPAGERLRPAATIEVHSASSTPMESAKKGSGEPVAIIRRNETVTPKELVKTSATGPAVKPGPAKAEGPKPDTTKPGPMAAATAKPSVKASTSNDHATAVPAGHAPGVVFGGKGLAKYHLPGCRFGERIPQNQRVTFHSAEDAEKNGRTPCPICHADQPGH